MPCGFRRPARRNGSRPPRRRSGWPRGGTSSCARCRGGCGQDLLCLCTDGLVDARDADGEAFGEARLLEGVIARRHLPPEEIVAALHRRGPDASRPARRTTSRC